MSNNGDDLMTDIEIANKCYKKEIKEIAKQLKIENNIELYGNYKAKINFSEIQNKELGKLILVTSINPTPYGEGKTTVSIGLHDALCKLNKKSLAVLREPSLGPVFGIKGGATGGGYSQVVPMEDINLHFTGDIHAITTANNLISAAIDNHIYFGNKLNINLNKINFKRCLDMNDRALRNVTLKSREESFNITAASEIMSILCLSNDFNDLKKNLANILIAYDKDDKPIYSRDLKLEGSLAVILKDAIKPNLVQTLENNPVIIHGGPFANIAHGCNSIIATRLGLKLADYVITEAGFGSDLGAEKFFDIKCRKANLKPSCVVIVATIKALKHNANLSKEQIQFENVNAVYEGLKNLEVHIENMLKYTKNIIVTLNKYESDTSAEIDVVTNYLQNKNIPFSINDAYSKGSDGAVDLAKKVIDISNNQNDFKLLYDLNVSIKEKIETISTNIYHAKKVNYTPLALEKINNIETLNLDKLPICIAKTQYSISDNPKLLGYPKDYEIEVKDINIYTGAGFIVVYLGSIMTMPGLSKNANYENIDIDEFYNIKGIF
jgi:formate--tetrahydrofolate ligase